MMKLIESYVVLSVIGIPAHWPTPRRCHHDLMHSPFTLFYVEEDHSVCKHNKCIVCTASVKRPMRVDKMASLTI